MPLRAHAADWEVGLRNQLRNTVGSAYRIGEQRGKAKLDVRFSDGTRKTKSLGIPWLQASAGGIQKAVEAIAQGVAVGLTIEEALEAHQGQQKQAPLPTKKVDPNQLVSLFDQWLESLSKLGKVRSDTQFKYTRNRLVQATAAASADQLLETVGDMFPKPGRSKEIRLQHLARFFRWAVEKKHLDAKRWMPPVTVKDVVGDKEKKPKVGLPLQDQEILDLIESLPTDKAGERWKTVLRFLAAYGLRPVEIQHLSIHADDGRLWCDYIKRSGKGETDPRVLKPLHEEWEQEWGLLEQVANGLDLPPFGGGVANAGRRYLTRQQGWKPLEAKGVTMYSFRHGYALRAHQQYGLSARIAARVMGHSVQTHNENYGTWADVDEIDKAYEAGKRYRQRLKG